MLFSTKVKNFQRLQEIIKILLKYGFEDVVSNTSLSRFVPIDDWKRDNKPVLKFSRSERIRMVIEELGPTFVKFAQTLSNRPDILPQDLIEEFQKLQDSVAPFSEIEAMAIVEKETGMNLNDFVTFFDNKPLGAASIGQVHRARLKTGQDVVIKIQRPGAREQVETDLRLLREFIKHTGHFFNKYGILNPEEIIQTFEESIINELDYTIEAKNIVQFRIANKDNQKLHIPYAHLEYTTKKLLVMEYVSGCKITDKRTIESWGLDLKQVALDGLHLYLDQIFNQGYFHADPHPGNVLIRPDGKIILIDFGMIGRLTKYQRFGLANFLTSMGQGDARGMAMHLRRIAKETDTDDPRKLEQDLNELVDKFVVHSSNDASMADITGTLQEIIYRNRLAVPGSIFMILRALAILEGICNVLWPTLEVLPEIEPYGIRLSKEQFSFKNLSSDFYYSFYQVSSLFYNLPMEVRYILKKTRTGKLVINFEHKGLEPLIHQFKDAASNLNIALVILALLISSSIVMTAPIPYTMRNSLGMPMVSSVGYGLSLVLMIYLTFKPKKKK
ncbi:ABC1 kinase family protein [Flammeovirga kamogawensis]|uniref:AarF/ABC1/UbiB kinase family protein n=1 Tax=Flammeovirga kamogawensis TaxID=373891 RepID=A0ABX8GXM0_9BACT|nr:AarF/UbiB family protein [Flammeovirga kamogawensis]MBB6460589.1 ubiquinone biosynthesis protein [Flammeovirga kamogawensis]QWG07947.1 AarF/ABC1/UbiB kinase family protein [Flammeovirga kamogawensis]TRX69756.1 AarF/ABC1/UbiB kinase family protein [Flammeovirga kamogawensis]